MALDKVEFTPTKKRYDSKPAMIISKDKKYIATIKTNKGDIILNLFAKTAPMTVNNFVFLARAGFYNDVIFHRIIPDFVIQGGDPGGNGMGGPGYSFEDEFNNDTPQMLTGTIAMANSGPNTNGSQFFICLTDLPHLNNKHTPFGILTSKMDILVDIANEETDLMDKPINPVIIKEILIEEN